MGWVVLSQGELTQGYTQSSTFSNADDRPKDTLQFEQITHLFVS